MTSDSKFTEQRINKKQQQQEEEEKQKDMYIMKLQSIV